MDKTVFFSESGSWDNMVYLSTKSFPGAQFWLARERLGFMPRKTVSRPVLSRAEAYSSLWGGPIRELSRGGKQHSPNCDHVIIWDFTLDLLLLNQSLIHCVCNFFSFLVHFVPSQMIT